MQAMTRMADTDVIGLVRSAARGDEVAFARIVDAYDGDMRRVSTFVARDHDIVDDAVASAWAIAWRKLGSVREAYRVRPWLVRVAVNEAKQQLRGRGRRAQVEALVSRMGAPGGADPETGIDALDLRAALGHLGPDDRALLAMRYVAGFSATELAEALGITPSGTRNRLERLMARLRQELRDG
jgi:RNA polymerase sigma factor (sigma-70 family)